MYTKEQITQIVEQYIASLPIRDTPKELYEPITYTLEEGGKRVRPNIMLLACRAFGGDINAALPVAAAVEVFHNFTLLHDDIMDNAEVRRGKPTVHKKWGQNGAILSGDVMLIYSFKLLRNADHRLLPTILDEFTTMSAQVCEGQQYDMEFESRDDVTMEEYMNMIRLKTAVLFGGSAKLGGIIAGASEADCRALYDFGIEMGLAFQLQDDYLDTYGTTELLGKAIGGDIAEGKKTFLTITALNEAGEATKRAILATFNDNSHPAEHKFSRIKTIYNSVEVPEITKRTISTHIDNALAAIDSLGIDDDKKAPLKELVESLADRSK